MTRTVFSQPLFSGRLRERIEDFDVTEVLGFEPDGGSAHELLFVEKRDTNTQWLQRQLARHAGVENRDVGYSGLKDRRAVTRQWFSIPNKAGTDWGQFSLDGVRLLRVEGHSRKLRIGSHRRNDFRIVIRSDASFDDAAIAGRVAAIRAHGVPNYFGVQRFGHGNLDLARSLFKGKRLRRDKRSIAISAARSQIFNSILEARVENGSWNRIVAGELANLDGSNSIFSVPVVDSDIARRCAELDIHPTGTLWGEGAPACSGELAEFERAQAARDHELADGLARLKVKPAQRALRMLALDLEHSTGEGECVLSFGLMRGCYATTLLEEFGEIEAVTAES